MRYQSEAGRRASKDFHLLAGRGGPGEDGAPSRGTSKGRRRQSIPDRFQQGNIEAETNPVQRESKRDGEKPLANGDQRSEGYTGSEPRSVSELS